MMGMASTRWMVRRIVRLVVSFTAPSFLLGLFRVVRDGGADQRLERFLVDLVAFMEVDGAPGAAGEAGVEQARGIGQSGALREGHLHSILVSLAGEENAVMIPGGDAPPFPFLH